MSYDFNADDVFEMEEQMERNGGKFYRMAADSTEDSANKEFLLELAAMEDQQTAHDARRKIATQRDYLSARISQLGLSVVPSQTNFILFKFEDEIKTATAANDFLLSHGYILRYYSGQGLEKFLRLTVGNEKENKEVIRLLAEFLGN